mmetsp:Transcript_18302/g.25449  ORF Transcript_18302/g.25449 Transcript_18302/m.25449 type:complete len:209 (+) Transcript_18302:622-1248(+)
MSRFGVAVSKDFLELSPGVVDFVAVIQQLVTYFSMPVPGAQPATISLKPFFSLISIFSKPALSIIFLSTLICSHPPIQPQMSLLSFLRSSGISVCITMSLIASLPPGLRTRYASLNTDCFSVDRLMTQFEIITSAVESPIGICSISPSRNSQIPYLDKSVFLLARALCTISGVMSTPITLPFGDTCGAAMKASRPPPLPRSTTTSPGA